MARSQASLGEGGADDTAFGRRRRVARQGVTWSRETRGVHQLAEALPEGETCV